MNRWIGILLLWLPLALAGQQSNLGGWMGYFGNKKLSDSWNLHHEVQWRNYNAAGDLEQLLLRTGIGRNLTEGNNNILLGYGFIHSENYVAGTEDKTDVDEHRIFQQFITLQQIARVGVQHRYRFEQRWVGSDFRLRYRYFLGLNIPLTSQSMQDKTLYLSLYNEIFLNAKATIFDRNRSYGGLGYKFNKNVCMELAYLNQFLQKGSRDQLNLNVFVVF